MQVSFMGFPVIKAAVSICSLFLFVLPTLPIPWIQNAAVIELNRYGHSKLSAAKEMSFFPGAGRLFQEPGMLEQA